MNYCASGMGTPTPTTMKKEHPFTYALWLSVIVVTRFLALQIIR
jgi:hypothetical protein